jgi:hypothetical protein
VSNRGNDRRINGAALEMIMQDVLNGMQSFTRDTCASCARGTLDIVAVERPDQQPPTSAEIIPFRKPGKRR